MHACICAVTLRKDMMTCNIVQDGMIFTRVIDSHTLANHHVYIDAVGKRFCSGAHGA